MREHNFEFGLLKTSYGMAKRFEGILKPLNVYAPVKNEKVEMNVNAISLFYGVSKRVAIQYYELISIVNKSYLTKIRRELGLE